MSGATLAPKELLPRNTWGRSGCSSAAEHCNVIVTESLQVREVDNRT